MPSTLKSLRALADPTRLRIVALLESGELSVNELQEVTALGQSRVSTHLSLLAETGLVASRRDGKRTFYRLNRTAEGDVREFTRLAMRGARELPEHGADQVNLRRVLSRREEQAQVYFNQVAGRFDRSYGPGRSWQAFGHLLLRILPPIEVADLGSGEGLLAELLARRCKRVIAVDNSEKMVAFGALQAKKNGLHNLEFRQGDLLAPPLAAGEADMGIVMLVFHHVDDPAAMLRAIAPGFRTGGALLVVDMASHDRSGYQQTMGHRHLGFSEQDLQGFARGSGFALRRHTRLRPDTSGKGPGLFAALFVRS